MVELISQISENVPNGWHLEVRGAFSACERDRTNAPTFAFVLLKTIEDMIVGKYKGVRRQNLSLMMVTATPIEDCK